MNLTKCERQAIDAALNHDGWIRYNEDHLTVAVVRNLELMGLVENNEDMHEFRCIQIREVER